MYYGNHHLTVKCTLSARELERVISNYEALTEVKRSKVPATMHLVVKSFVGNDLSPAEKITASQYIEAHSFVKVRGPAARSSPMSKPNGSEH